MSNQLIDTTCRMCNRPMKVLPVSGKSQADVVAQARRIREFCDNELTLAPESGDHDGPVAERESDRPAELPSNLQAVSVRRRRS